MIRAIVCDDHPVVREGVRLVLDSSGDIQLQDEASNGRELLEKVRARRFDVIILDISFPEGPAGLEVLESLQREHTPPAVLVLSAHPEKQAAVRALRAGAAGYLVKDSGPEELLAAVRKVASVGTYVSAGLAEAMAENLDGARAKLPHETLSDREYQVLCLLARGKGISEAARTLCVSPSTIGDHRARILRKLGLKNNAELVRYALDNGLLD